MRRARAIFASLAVTVGAGGFALAAEGTLLVRDAQDVVRLVGGAEVTGTVVASGMKAVVVLVRVERADGEAGEPAEATEAEAPVREVVIPRERVERIVRGAESPDPAGYSVAVVDGVKRVTGVVAAPAVAAGAASKPPAAAASTPPAAKTPAGQPTADELIATARQDPRLKQIVDSVGEDRLRNVIEQNRSNKQATQLIEQFLKTGQVPPFIMPLLDGPRK